MTGALQTETTWANAFDGDFRASSYIQPNSVANGAAGLTLPQSIEDVTRFDVYCYEQTSSYTGAEFSIETSGGTQTLAVTSSGLPEGWNTIYTGSALSVTGLGLKKNIDGSGAAVLGYRYFKADGTVAMLIDANIQDSVLDTPMNNYAVLINKFDNPMFNGNLVAKTETGGGTIGLTSGRVYLEGVGIATGDHQLGVCKVNDYQSDYATYADGDFNSSDTSKEAYGEPWSTGDIIGAAVDMDTKTVTFFKNGVPQGTKDLPKLQLLNRLVLHHSK